MHCSFIKHTSIVTQIVMARLFRSHCTTIKVDNRCACANIHTQFSHAPLCLAKARGPLFFAVRGWTALRAATITGPVAMKQGRRWLLQPQYLLLLLLLSLVRAEECPYPCVCHENSDAERTLTVDCRNQELFEIPLGIPPTTSHLSVLPLLIHLTASHY